MRFISNMTALAALAVVLASPVIANAQNVTVGAVRSSGAAVPDTETDGIASAQRAAFKAYVLQESVPTFTVPDRVAVGATLPEAGVTYYDVPQSFGATTNRYTVVNGETILVEPRTRRIVQVID